MYSCACLFWKRIQEVVLWRGGFMFFFLVQCTGRGGATDVFFKKLTVWFFRWWKVERRNLNSDMLVCRSCAWFPPRRLQLSGKHLHTPAPFITRTCGRVPHVRTSYSCFHCQWNVTCLIDRFSSQNILMSLVFSYSNFKLNMSVSLFHTHIWFIKQCADVSPSCVGDVII